MRVAPGPTGAVSPRRKFCYNAGESTPPLALARPAQILLSTMGKRAKKKRPKQYAVAIPEREEILQCLERVGAPQGLDAIAAALGLQGDEEQAALGKRLKAMLRDGQVMRNRNADYGLLDKMDLTAGRVIGHAGGYGFLRPDQGGGDLYLSERQMRAVLHGDHVVARAAGVDRRGRREAVIVEVLERARQSVVGRFFLEDNVGFIVPDDRRLSQDILVPSRQRKKAQTGDYVVAALTRQPDGHAQPLGKIVEVLGRSSSIDMATDIAIRAYDIPHQWPDEVKKELAGLARRGRGKNRKDLRDLSLVTIDGEDAKDFDDAVYCERQGAEWRLVVAIADVSHYVQPGTALDEAARERGNSVYFPNRVAPMLPERLSNDLCSLKPDADRLALACELRVNRAGRVRRCRLFPALIRSRARLTYATVEALIKGGKAQKKHRSLRPHIRDLRELYALMRGAREQRGALDFSSTEIRFSFDKQGKATAINAVERLEAHRIIEEFMLAANVAVAEFLLANKTPALFRNHPVPKEEKVDNLNQFLADFGLQLGGGRDPKAKDYARVLRQVATRDDRHVIETVLLRSMSLAVYEGKSQGHFGLAFDHYAHFTSPIRRYPDLLVHRAIRKVLEQGPYPYSQSDLDNYGAHCSMTERRAEEAVRDVAARIKCEFMSDKIGEVFGGIVSGVTSFGLFVELDDIYVEGLAHISSLPADYYHFNPITHSLSGERTGRKHFLGDRVRVRVSKVNVDERKIDFDCLD